LFSWFILYEFILISWLKSWVWWVNPGELELFVYFLKLFFKKIIPSTLSWLRIILHNLFQFTFYRVILVSWPESWIWQADLYFFVSFLIFFQHHLIVNGLRIKLYNLFYFALYRANKSYDLGHGFKRLIWINLICCRFNVFFKGYRIKSFLVKLCFYTVVQVIFGLFELTGSN